MPLHGSIPAAGRMKNGALQTVPVTSSIAIAAWSSCCCWKQEQWQQQEATEGLNDNSEEKSSVSPFLPEEEDGKPAENPHMTLRNTEYF